MNESSSEAGQEADKLYRSMKRDFYVCSAMCWISNWEDHLQLTKLKNTSYAACFKLKQFCVRHLYKRDEEWHWWWVTHYQWKWCAE